MDVFRFAYFPFVNAAAKYVEALDFKLEELFSERAFEQVKELREDELKEFALDFNINAVLDEKGAIIHFTDYIRYANVIHEPKWKLVNRNIDHGRVSLSREDFSRLMEEAIRKRIEQGLPL